MTSVAGSPHQLAYGRILEIAVAGGVEAIGDGHKRPICCPIHEDNNPSAFLDLERNVFYCSVCTPDRGWSARRFAEELRVPWEPGTKAWSMPLFPRIRIRAAVPTFTPADARVVWDRALTRARDEEQVGADHFVYDFLRSRGLIEAWESSSFGIVAHGMDLPPAIAGWPHSGHQLVVPLYDDQVNVSNVQARAVGRAERKTLFPVGSVARGMHFASRTGLDVLRRKWTGPKLLVVGEGLTDFLALSITSPVPVLAAPGTGFAATGVGPWVAGFTVLLALDNDQAGDAAAKATARQLFEHGATRVLRQRWPGAAKDAAEALQRLGPGRLSACIEGAFRG